MYKIKIKNMSSKTFFSNLCLPAFCLSAVFFGCNSSAGNEGPPAIPLQSLPVITVVAMPATTTREFSASLEGKMDIQIRAQVNGYIERIFIDEGAYVKKGQPLFKINDQPYRQQVNNARAGVTAAKSNLTSAQINVSRLAPLVKSNIISEVQLKTAQAVYEAALANVAQAEAMVNNAQINLGYTVVKAPANGYIGRIPFKTGSLVGTSVVEPLTVLSNLNEVYAYFSLSENDFIQFKEEFSGKTVEEKIRHMPPVELLLPNDSVYPNKGKVEIASGQFNNTMGAISFRASFPNSDGLLRSGNTGKVRLPHAITSALIVPQEATFELQDRTFVFVLGDSNKVTSFPIKIAGKSGNYYLVEDGLKPKAKVVYSGTDRLKDGDKIQPQFIALDSLLKARPL